MSDAGEPIFEQVTVVGLGLLGGSLAMAVRRRRLARRVVGVCRRRETAEAALRAGMVDEAGTDAARLVPGTQLLVLATPVHAMADALREAAPFLSEEAVVTDVGSVKGGLAETLPGLLPPGVRYVGAHPMAGSHARGVEHAREGLFEGAACVVASGPEIDPAAREQVRRLFAGVGARLVERTPAQHDAEVAWVSHVPHALAFAYAHALAAAPAGAGAVRGPGFRDFTRIAQADPELWADILCSNGKALAGPLAAVAAALERLSRSVEQGDAEATERFLAEARDALARLAQGAPSGGGNPEIHSRKER